MEGQTNCVLCEYTSRNNSSLKQHMESKHKVFNMTIVQVLTQQVERVNDLEVQVKSKEQLIQKAELDLDMTKEALKKEKESLQEKEKDFDELITSNKLKSVQETKLVEELKVTKDLLTKAQQDLVAKTNALDAELGKVKVSEVSTQTGSDINEVPIVKEEACEANKEKKKLIPCKYFHTTKGCRRETKCWFYHGDNLKVDKKSTKLKQNTTENFKEKTNMEKESKQKQNENLKHVIVELLKILLRESDF